MALFSLKELNEAEQVVRRKVPRTPSYAWPLLEERLGLKVWVKHENHTPIGAFKARSVINFLSRHIAREGKPSGVVTATRGNHGQAVAIAAKEFDVPAVVVVPQGNAEGKNAAMAAFGAEVVIEGEDFDQSREVAARIARDKGYLFIPSFHRDIVMGVATYAREFFEDAGALDVVYVPIGLGSGICALITVRDLLGLKTEIVGVVAEKAPAYALSFEQGAPVSTNRAATFADGVACRVPDPAAFEIIAEGAARVITVSEAEMAEAIRILFADTHNLAEGAGAAALAGLMKERAALAGKRAGVVLTGGNIDAAVLTNVLGGHTPTVGA